MRQWPTEQLPHIPSMQFPISKNNALSFASVVDLLLDAVCVVDANGYFVFGSAACESIFGYTPEEMIGRRMIDMVHPDDREMTLQAAQRIMSGQTHLHFENRYLRKDGQVVHIMWSARWSDSDRLRIAVARDVTARKRSELLQAATYAISESAHAAGDLATLFEKIHQIIKNLLPSPNFAVALIDAKTQSLNFPYCVDVRQPGHSPRTAALDAFCQEVLRSEQILLLNRDASAEIPEHPGMLFDEDLKCWLGVPLKSQNGIIGALLLKSYVGDAAYGDKDKELLQYVSTQIATAIERVQLFTRLQYLAQYDELTDLPNRGLLHDRLKTAITRAHRERRFLSVLYLDLDKFKQVNDSLGHALGDQLLKAFAHRLKKCVRESDTVARVGGDEFVLLLESEHLPDTGLSAIHKIRDAFDDPFFVNEHTIRIKPSIGVAHYPEHGVEVHELLRYADSAMYIAKKRVDEYTPR